MKIAPTYGVSTYLALDLPRDRFIATLAENGFGEIELAAKPGSFGNWLADPAGVRRELAAAGLRVHSVHAPSTGWANSTLDPDARRRVAAAAASCLWPAAEVGAELVVWHPRGGEPDLITAELAGKHRANAVTALAEFAARAQAAGLGVAVENLPRSPGRPFCSVAELLSVVQELGPGVGICLDVGHSNVNGLSPAAEARLAGKRLLSMHLHDNGGSGQDEHLLPGRGSIDWPELLGALDEAASGTVRMFEVIAASAEEAAPALAAMAALAREWSWR